MKLKEIKKFVKINLICILFRKLRIINILLVLGYWPFSSSLFAVRPFSKLYNPFGQRKIGNTKFKKPTQSDMEWPFFIC